jgi:2-aminoethylphosphonate transport system ATP-binding protein
LAIQPQVLLLDEPLAALDAQLRADMLGELQKLRREVPEVAILYVTHDQAEALALADRIAVMRDARLVDIAPAADLYAAPPSAFTASFLGGANLLPVEVAGDEVQLAGHSVLRIATDRSATDRSATDRSSLDAVGARPAANSIALSNQLLVIRPHAIKLEAGGIPGRLVAAQWRGASSRLTCTIDGLPDVPVHVDVPADGRLPEVGSKVSLVLPVEACSLVAAEGR